MRSVTEQHGGVSFGVDEETRLILDSIDEFIEQEVKPRESELGETFDNPRLRNAPNGEVAPEVIEAVDEVRSASADAGFYAMNMPEEHGGQDVSNVTWYRAKRHVAEKGRGLSEFMLAGPEGPKPLLLQAEGEQVEKYLEPCIRGEKTTAFALTEPSVGSDAPGMKTTAEKDGDEWVINGQKQWITNAPHCDFAQVFARTTPVEDAGRYGGITCFLVESDEFELGSRNNAVGLEGLQAEIVLNDVRVPDSRVLGTRDAAFYNAMSFLSLGRLELGATAVGMARHLLGLCQRARGVRAPHRQVPEHLQHDSRGSGTQLRRRRRRHAARVADGQRRTNRRTVLYIQVVRDRHLLAGRRRRRTGTRCLGSVGGQPVHGTPTPRTRPACGRGHRRDTAEHGRQTERASVTEPLSPPLRLRLPRRLRPPARVASPALS